MEQTSSNIGLSVKQSENVSFKINNMTTQAALKDGDSGGLSFASSKYNHEKQSISGSIKPRNGALYSDRLPAHFTSGRSQWAFTKFSSSTQCSNKETVKFKSCQHITHSIYKCGERTNEERKRRSNRRTSHIHSTCLKLFLFLIIMDIPGIDTSVLSKMACDYFKYLENCTAMLNQTAAAFPPNKTYCPGEFDTFICWPHGEPDTAVHAPCPSYLDWGNESRVGFRYCEPDGTWYGKYDERIQMTVPWSRIDACNVEDIINNMPGDKGQVKVLEVLRIIYTTGYVISLLCLFFALLILTIFKNLHCTRNYIHINLMISFILRYSITIVKDVLLDMHYSINESVLNVEGKGFQQYCEDYSGWVLPRCRLILTLMHYTTIANFFWLLVEGVYLQMLLTVVMLEDKFFAVFMLLGWVGPWCFVLVWVYLRLSKENMGCWDVNNNTKISWAIRSPTILSILINFIIFVNIVRLIVSKLRANNMSRTDYKFRLAKSTLALIPLLGIHYILLIVITDEMEKKSSKLAINIKLCIDMILTSFQGTLVAVFYCFLNGEVQTEVKKWWNDRSWKRGIARQTPLHQRKGSYFPSNGSQPTSAIYMSRHSAVESEIQSHFFKPLTIKDAENNDTDIIKNNISDQREVSTSSNTDNAAAATSTLLSTNQDGYTTTGV